MNKIITRQELSIIRILHELSQKEQEILIKRFIKNKSQEEVGKDYNVTNERIRQIENKALEVINTNLK